MSLHTTQPPAEITSQLSAACTIIKRHLADTVEAIHLFGSAVNGGLKPHSDIDLMVTVNAPLAAPVRLALMKDLLPVSSPPSADASLRPLEVTVVVRSEVVPWRYPPMRELQFGEWLRDALQAGIVEPAVADHDLAILLTEVRLHGICLLGPAPVELFDAVPQADFSQSLRDTIAQWNDEPDWHGDERNVVLALARIWFTAATGGIAPKDVAAAWVLERLPHDDALRSVLTSAREAYLGNQKDDLASRPVEVTMFVRFAKAAIESRGRQRV